MNPSQRGPVWTPITPPTGSLFHAETHFRRRDTHTARGTFGGNAGISRFSTYDPSLLVPAAARERDAANIDHQVIRHVEELCNTVAEKSQLVDGRLPGYLDAVDYLSSSIVQARAEFAGKRVFSNVIMQLFEWTIVATGLFTTILISVKAFASPKSKGFVSMAVTAIALSSLGTSVATLNSFYRPRTTFETADRSLSMLQGLHRSLAAGLIRQ